MKVTILCDPPKHTHQGSLRILKRSDGTQFVGKMKTSKGKAQYDYLSLQLSQSAPSMPLEGPVRVNLGLVYPYRKGEPQWRTKARLRHPKDTRPDCDNLVKLILDCMTELEYWNDDGQIYSLTVEKYWGPTPLIELEVTEYEPF